MRSRATVGIAALACAAAAAGALSATATAQVAAPGGGSTAGGKAFVKPNGKAVPPANAPKRVRKAINAGNRIRKKPYVYGGGHRGFKARGYDCSGAVSYVLHAAGVLKRPMPSGPMARWGVRGRGDWITVYASSGHAFVVVAGLRFDTSSAGDPNDQGSGPRWRANGRSGKGYKKRSHPKL
jgi:cell wall-associated NlpC family hydrolase